MLRERTSEMSRFVGNGIFATIIHFCALKFAISVLNIPLASIASLFAVVFGVSASFLGNRYFVFKSVDQPLQWQLTKFLGLYMGAAIFHASFLFFWTDMLTFNVNSGFLLATAVLTTVSYFGNRHLVFVR